MRYVLFLMLACVSMYVFPASAAQMHSNAEINECKHSTLVGNAYTEESAHFILPGTAITVLCPDGTGGVLRIASGGTIWGLIDQALSMPQQEEVVEPSPLPVAKVTEVSSPVDVFAAAAPAVALERENVETASVPRNIMASPDATPVAYTKDQGFELWLIIAMLLLLLVGVLIIMLTPLRARRASEGSQDEDVPTHSYRNMETRLAHAEETIAALRRELDVTRIVSEGRLREIDALTAAQAEGAKQVKDQEAPVDTSPEEHSAVPVSMKDERYTVICTLSSGAEVDVTFTLTGVANKTPTGRIFDLARGPWKDAVPQPLLVRQEGRPTSLAKNKLLIVLNRMNSAHALEWFKGNGYIPGTHEIVGVRLKASPSGNVVSLQPPQLKVVGG